MYGIEEDITQLKANLVVLVSRVLCKYIKCLQKYNTTVASHIPHIHSKEMANKSEAVVLDVLHKDETKGAEMIDIMVEMHEYLGESSKTRLSGGDYVTVERQRGAKQDKHNSETRKGKLAMVEGRTMCRRLALPDECHDGEKNVHVHVHVI